MTPLHHDLADCEPCDLEGLHRGLASWNQRRLSVGRPTADWQEGLREEHRMRWLEGLWIEGLRAEVAERAAEAPLGAAEFVAWFEDLRETGPGQNDPLFAWLRDDADLSQMRWFLTQEAAGEAGFDDLVALTQVKMPDRPKLELARNYWDEMGRGGAQGMHGRLLEQTTKDLGLKPTIAGTAWESLALANTLTAFATTRRYAYHSIGALGVVELTAPGRVACVADGLKRLGCPPSARKYFALHAHLDVQHSKAWNEEALEPLVEADPSCARYIAEGALIRLLSGRRCFEAYRSSLWGHGATGPDTAALVA
jgi:hypothetical protein